MDEVLQVSDVLCATCLDYKANCELRAGSTKPAHRVAGQQPTRPPLYFPYQEMFVEPRSSPFAISSCLKAKMRYSSPPHRILVWLKPHPAYIPSWRLHNSVIGSSKARERPSRSHASGATALYAEMMSEGQLFSDIFPCRRSRFPYHYSLRQTRDLRR